MDYTAKQVGAVLSTQVRILVTATIGRERPDSSRADRLRIQRHLPLIDLVIIAALQRPERESHQMAASDRPEIIPDGLRQLGFLVTEMGANDLFQFSKCDGGLSEICL